MIGHQNVFADVYSALQTGFAKLPKVFVNFGASQNAFSIFRARSDEVKRMADEKSVEALKSLFLRRLITASSISRVHGR
jgi:hypothetical protein